MVQREAKPAETQVGDDIAVLLALFCCLALGAGRTVFAPKERVPLFAGHPGFWGFGHYDFSFIGWLILLLK